MDPRPSLILSSLTNPEVDAMVEIMLLAACSDGSFDNAENVVLKQNLHSVDEFWLNHVALEERIRLAQERIVAEGWETRLEKLRTMLPWPEQRLVALRLAIRIVSADGAIQPCEREHILKAAEVLGVRQDFAAELDGKKA